MPKTRSQTTKLETRLNQEDRARFEELVKRRGITRTELVREALIFYLDNHESEEEAAKLAKRDKVIADSLKSIENRFASLIVRLGIDLESLYALLWASSPKENREELFEKCYRVGQERFRRKLSNLEQEFKGSLKKQPDRLSESNG